MKRIGVARAAVFLGLLSIFPQSGLCEFQTIYSLGLSLDGGPGPLLRQSDGSFYGVLAAGGRLGRGSIFHLSADGSSRELVFDFADSSTNDSSTAGVLIGVTNGVIYGVFTDFPPSGGTNLVYRIATNGTGFRVMQGLPNVFNSLMLASDGRFYVMVNSGLDRFETDGSAYTSVTNGLSLFRAFEGTDGMIYGLLTGQTLCRLRKDGSGLTTLTNTSRGVLTFIQGRDGWLYGAEDNFPNGEITFALNSDGTGFRELGNISSGGQDSSMASLLDGEDGKLYATFRVSPAQLASQIISIDKAGGVAAVLNLPPSYGDNAGSQAISLGLDGKLYGTASIGGTNGGGVIYQVQRDGTGLHELFQLGGEPGSFVQSGLALGSDQRLYGATREGGFAEQGMLFALNVDGSGFTVLKEFHSTLEGASPRGGVIEGPGGVLYGTTQAGGSNNCGTVFRVNRDGAGFQTLFHFDANTGTNPLAQLLLASDGALYGSCNLGGTSATNGTLWKVQTNGSGFTVLKKFSPDGKEGRRPFAPLIEGADGMLYGVTDGGGSAEKGIVFKLAKDGSGYQVLRNLLGFGDAANPEGALLQLSSGILIGTASAGGVNGLGAIFSIQTNGLAYQVVHSFVSTNSDARTPIGGLLERTDGSLLGTTRFGGGQAVGTVYSIRPDGTEYQILHRFSNIYPSPQEPWATLTAGPGVSFFGAASLGGLSSKGAIFKLDFGNPELPAIEVHLEGSVLRLSWSASASNYQLQSASNLDSSSNWQEVLQPPTLNNGKLSLSLPLSLDGGFYRLKKF